MCKIEVKHGSYGPSILQDGMIVYEIGWLQIVRDGVDKWVAHLKEKRWFTHEAETAFREVCGYIVSDVYFQ